MTREVSGLFGRGLGIFAAATFIAASASQNALHGWQLGLRTSEITATIFAAASIAGAIMMPIALAAAFRAFRNLELGNGVVAALLAACCFTYAIVSSVGFVSGARDHASASRSADADAYTLAKAKSEAAVAELKTLADAKSRKAATRRAELEATIAAAESVMQARRGAGQADPTASTIAAYAGAIGFDWKPDELAPWLSLLAVVFFELGAAASLIVIAPSASMAAKAEEASAEAPVADQTPTMEPQPSGKQRGRKRATPLEKIQQRIADAGGRLEGSYEDLGGRLGVSKASAYRSLNALAAAGLVKLAASPCGTIVQAIGQRV